MEMNSGYQILILCIWDYWLTLTWGQNVLPPSPFGKFSQILPFYFTLMARLTKLGNSSLTIYNKTIGFFDIFYIIYQKVSNITNIIGYILDIREVFKN